MDHNGITDDNNLDVCFLYSVVNEPLESISLDLGFGGNTLAEGYTLWIFLPLSYNLDAHFFYLDLLLIINVK